MLSAVLVSGSAVIAAGVAERRQAVDPEALALQTFADRVKGYVELRDRLERELPPVAPTDDPARFEEHQRALVAAIQRARANAQPGDIFTPIAAAVFRSVFKEHFKDRPREDFYATLGEIPRSVRLEVNAPYPSSVPLATFPPLLLAKLPPLPDQVEYGLAGRALILRDVRADLIVDFMKNALPSRP